MTAGTWARRALTWPGALLMLTALLALYFLAIRPWMNDWGATTVERAMPLPGDELNAHPDTVTTRAVTIHAPADVVWAWLVQIGADRAGFYSYDWLENLVGAGIRNADRVHPEWQSRQPGDFIPGVQEGWLGGGLDGKAGWETPIVVPGRALVLKAWGAFVIIPVDADTTRLVARSRTGDAAANRVEQLGAELFGLGMDPAHFVMERQMLLGIKARAEGEALVPGPLDAAARAGWALAAVAVVAVLLLLRWRWLLLSLAPAALIVASTGDFDSALAAFLAIGIAVAGVLRWGRRWWPSFSLLAAVVLLVLLFAPEAYVAFGLIFSAALLLGAAWWGMAASGIWRPASGASGGQRPPLTPQPP